MTARVNESSGDDPLRAVNAARRWPRVGRIAEEFLGAVLVAVVLGLVGAWYSVRDSVDINRDTLTAHKYQLKTISDFQDKGARFTARDAKILVQDIEDLEARADGLGVRLAGLEQRCGQISVEIARLPPALWQSRILALERDLSVIKGKLAQ